MTVPNVTFKVLNGKLGVRAPGGVECHAYLGPASAAAVNVPTRHVRGDDLLARYGSGPGPELAVSGIVRWKADALFIRTNTTTPGAYGVIDVSGVTGTATVTVDATTHPDDDYEALVEFQDGGVVGTPGITYLASLDNGRTFLPLASLGTAGFITIPNSGGITFVLHPPTAAVFTSVNGLRTALLAHFIKVSGSPATHIASDTTDNTALTAIPAATTEATAIAAFNGCLSLLAVHVASTTYHTAADAGAAAALALLVPAVLLEDVVRQLPALITIYNAHRILVGAGPVHGSADSTNVAAASTAVGGTLNAGDTIKILAVAPAWSTGDLSTSLATLKTSKQPWKAAWIAGPCNAAALNVIKLFLDDLELTTGQSRKVYCSLRMPTPGEDKAAYLAAVAADRASFADKRIVMCSRAARVVSARTGRPFNFRRPSVFAIAGLPGALPLGIDMAQTVDATPEGLPGVSLYDENGNNVEHDEMLDPGDDDAGFLALRTWPGKEGVYVNNPTTLEVTGGDFHLDQLVRILCVFCDTTRGVLVDQLSKDLDLNLKTVGVNVAGAPTERECQRIDSLVEAALSVALKGQVTTLQFRLHRDDILQTTQTLKGDGAILYKGYPKAFEFTVAAINPATS